MILWTLNCFCSEFSFFSSVSVPHILHCHHVPIKKLVVVRFEFFHGYYNVNEWHLPPHIFENSHLWLGYFESNNLNFQSQHCLENQWQFPKSDRVILWALNCFWQEFSFFIVYLICFSSDSQKFSLVERDTTFTVRVYGHQERMTTFTAVIAGFVSHSNNFDNWGRPILSNYDNQLFNAIDEFKAQGG